VGFNHHFGYDKQGDYQYLYEMKDYFGFMVEEIPQQEIDQETVSSTRIRQTLSQGLIQKANAYYNLISFFGKVLNIEKIDKELTKIIVQTDEEEKIIPPTGIYAGAFQYQSQKCKCLIIIYDRQFGYLPQLEVFFKMIVK